MRRLTLRKKIWGQVSDRIFRFLNFEAKSQSFSLVISKSPIGSSFSCLLHLSAAIIRPRLHCVRTIIYLYISEEVFDITPHTYSKATRLKAQMVNVFFVCDKHQDGKELMFILRKTEDIEWNHLTKHSITKACFPLLLRGHHQR